MARTQHLSSFLHLTFVVLLLAACGSGKPTTTTPTTAPGATTVAPTTAPGATTEAPTAQPTPLTVGGPGAFNLPEPGAHLDVLSRYQAELRMQFTGEQDGQKTERSTLLTLSFAGPGAQVTRLETSATGEPPVFLLAGEVAGTRFLQSASDAPCSSLVDEQDSEAFTFGDPWLQLPAVYGAELVGVETINDFETEHYTFDQRAIRWAAGTTAQGDLWVAKGGGFLVRYRLTMQAPAGILAATASGEQTWEFNLSPLAESASLLPEGCAPVLTDFPMLPDAATAVRLPGFLSYTTGSASAEAIAFYRQELLAAGWQEQDAFNASADRTILFFVRPIMDGDTVTSQTVATITLRPAEAGLKVEVQLLRAEVPPPAAPGQ